MKKNLLYLLCMPLLLFLFLFPRESFQASCDGLVLWFHTLLPSLLPFMILSNLLLQSNLLEPLFKPLHPICKSLLGTSSYGAYAWILGIFCGFPMGAKLTNDLYLNGYIDHSEATYLLKITNHVSPMFIINFIVFQTFQERRFLFPVLGIYYASAFVSILLFRFVLKKHSESLVFFRKKEVSMTSSTGAILDTSIMNGFEIITRLGGYIILFSIYGALLRKLLLPFPMLQAIMAGFIEITTGITCIHNSTLPRNVQLFLTLCCMSFGGLSTIAQTNCVLQDSDLSVRTYIYGKLVHTAVTALILLLFFVFVV